MYYEFNILSSMGDANMDVANRIAVNVRAARERKKLTLDAAAELTGVSRSMLAQIEKGDVNPTITVLWKIANGFKVSFSSLMENKSEEVSIVRGGDASPLLEDDGRYRNFPTFLFDERKLFECYRIVIQPDGALSSQPHLANTEEYVTVFAGEIELTIDSENYRLGRGDSIRFRADVPHGYGNCGAGDAELHMLIYYNE